MLSSVDSFREASELKKFARNLLDMLSVSYAGKNAYSAGKTSGVLRGDTSGANRVSAHPLRPPPFWTFSTF